MLIFLTDQAYVCLENKVSQWKEAVDSNDAIVIHNPPESGEESVLAYVGKKRLFNISRIFWSTLVNRVWFVMLAVISILIFLH